MLNQDDLRARVGTIVIVMMENRSFDHVFGHLSLPGYGGRTDINGLPDLQRLDYGNPAGNGTVVQPFPMQDAPFPTDLPHRRDEVRMQIKAAANGRATMTGFVQAYEAHTSSSGVVRPPTMGILTPRDIPITSFLGQQYAICDSWFAPLPTSTAPNRLMAMCGYSMIDETSSLVPEQPSIYDWLTNRSIKWRVYHTGLPFLTLMPNVWHYMATDHFQRIGALAHDVQNEPDDTWPDVVFIEPDYQDSPVHLSGQACDNHPPLPMAFGEAFLRQVYQALTSNEKRWGRTVMVLCYDEHGGFYDHVAPKPIPSPTPPGASYEAFTTTGIRVPAVVVSPMVPAGKPISTLFDHTSILQLVAERFGSNGESFSTEVDQRKQAGIQSLSVALDSGPARTDIPRAPDLEIKGMAVLTSARDPKTPLETAFATQIEAFQKSVDPETAKKFPEVAHWMGTP